MKVTVKAKSPSMRILLISGDESDLIEIKKTATMRLQPKVSAPGFRKGKVPLKVVAKELGEKTIQTEVLEEAINTLYSRAMNQEKLRPLDQPKIEIKKFVPYSDIEFSAEVEIIPPVKLGDYKKIKQKRSKVEVKDKEIDEVIENMRGRVADKKDVSRPSKVGDEVIISFEAKDKKGIAVAGASGKDYPLRIGSKTFIPGFEENTVGLKAGENKTFELTFPKDYGHTALANKKVDFFVKISKVQSVKLPPIDDELAKKVAQIDTLDAFRNDIRAQLMSRKLQESDDKLKDAIVEELVNKSQIDVPEILIEDQMNHLKTDFLNDLAYRGITLKDYIDQLGVDEEIWIRQELRPKAERRVQVGLVLSEVARAENLDVTDEELALRIKIMKGQYQDPKTQAELDKPEQQRDIASRLLTEKTLNKLVDYATS